MSSLWKQGNGTSPESELCLPFCAIRVGLLQREEEICKGGGDWVTLVEGAEGQALRVGRRGGGWTSKSERGSTGVPALPPLLHQASGGSGTARQQAPRRRLDGVVQHGGNGHGADAAGHGGDAGGNVCHLCEVHISHYVQEVVLVVLAL